MNRAAYLAFQSAISGVSLVNLFKLAAIVAVMLGSWSSDMKGPWTNTFERTASVAELTQEVKFFADLFAPSNDRLGDVPAIMDYSIWPTSDKIHAVLAAEVCYRPASDQAKLHIPDPTCSPEQINRVENIVRWWAFFSLVLLTIAGFFGLWASVQWQHKVVGSKFGHPRSPSILKEVVENAISGSHHKSGKMPGVASPKGIEDLVSGDYDFKEPADVIDPAEPGLIFWLGCIFIIVAAFLIILDIGFFIALFIVLLAGISLFAWRVVYDYSPWSRAWHYLSEKIQPTAKSYPTAKEYRLVYHAAEKRMASVAEPVISVTEDPSATDPNVAELLRVKAERDDTKARLEVVQNNVKAFESFLKKAVGTVESERSENVEQKFALVVLMGLGALVVGNWIGACLIECVQARVFPGVDWSPADGLIPTRELWAAFVRVTDVNARAGQILLGIFAGLLVLSVVAALVADVRKRIWLNFVAIFSAWLLLVYSASLMTWLGGLPEDQPASQPVILVRGGLVCQVPSEPVLKAGEARRALSATWAFGDDGRAAFDLISGSDACALNDQMRYPNLTLSELNRGPGPAQLAIVVGLASFEGQDGTEAALAQRRAEALAGELLAQRRAEALAGEPEPLRVISVFLGRYNVRPAQGGGGPVQSASQRKVLVYLAGRRGSAARQEDLSPADEETLLRSLREDLRAAHRTEPSEYQRWQCKVERFSRDENGKTVVTTDPGLTSAFCPAFDPTVVENGARTPRT